MTFTTRRGRPSPIVVLFGVAGLTGAPSAIARDDAEPIQLAYHASTGCPDEASFVARIRARTGRARVAWAGEAARTFTVVVDAGPPPSGRVVVQGGDRAEGSRQVKADTCSDVADALALMVALAIDPRAIAQPQAPPPPAPSSIAAPSSAVSSHARSGEWFAGADLAAMTGVTPNALVGGSPYVGWRAVSSTILEPSIRLAFVRSGSGWIDTTGGGSAQFMWTVGRLDACPAVWPRGPVDVTECARVEAGTLEVGAKGVPSPQKAVEPWLAVGPLVRAKWSFLRWAFADAELGLPVRVVQDRFYFKSSSATVYQVPPIGLTAGFGVGVTFP